MIIDGQVVETQQSQVRESALVDRVQAIFTHSLNLTVPSTDSDLIEEGILDSLSLVSLLVQIEAEFGISISLEDVDFDDLRSIESISRLLTGRTAR